MAFARKHPGLRGLILSWALLSLMSTPVHAVPGLVFKPANALESAYAITNMLQDHQGFVWMATRAGLLRYDGYQIRHYSLSSSDASGLPHDTVTSLLEDGQHRLWVGTRAGLTLFHPESNHFQVFAPPVEQGDVLYSRQIQRMVLDGDHGLWLATRQGLQHFDPDSGQFRLYRHDPQRPDSLSKDNLQTLARDAQGGLWIAAWPMGLDRLAAGSDRFEHYQVDPQHLQSLDNAIKALWVDQQQRVWIGTETGVFLGQWREGRFQIQAVEVEDWRQPFRVNDFYEAKDGSLWAASFMGLLRWNEDKHCLEAYRNDRHDPNSLRSSWIFTLLQDGHENLFVSTSKGIDQVDLEDIRHNLCLMPYALNNLLI